ncbi:hypothetical protein AML91_00815 [Paenibacillus jilunlii]|uniref:Uncharacterized protein n=1 Tax=Paenibacillus jilunlii TaxID=682956 RepID=A0ABR5T2J0_9BACL|nr:hypothetical protein AML91_00815 [Paenibacillus jilunlii]
MIQIPANGHKAHIHGFAGLLHPFSFTRQRVALLFRHISHVFLLLLVLWTAYSGHPWAYIAFQI